MKYQDILIEAAQYGVRVEECICDTVHFHAPTGSHKATMFRTNELSKNSRRWSGVAPDSRGGKVRTEGSKAAVASWCLSEAANGPM